MGGRIMVCTLERVKLVLVTFGIPDPMMPSDLREERQEAPKRFQSGTPFLKTESVVSLERIPEQMMNAGFRLKDASRIFWKNCDAARTKNETSGRIFSRAHFAFVPSEEEVFLSEEQERAAREVFRKFCSDDLWRVRAFRSPLSVSSVSENGPQAIMMSFDCPKKKKTKENPPRPRVPKSRLVIGRHGFTYVTP